LDLTRLLWTRVSVAWDMDEPIVAVIAPISRPTRSSRRSLVGLLGWDPWLMLRSTITSLSTIQGEPSMLLSSASSFRICLKRPVIFAQLRLLRWQNM